MKKFFETLRLGAVFAVLILAMVFAGSTLMKIQVVDGAKYLEMSKSSKTATQTISAARGQIVDSVRRPLVENRVSYNVVINRSFFPDSVEEQNEVILKIAKILKNDGIEWIDEIPITLERPYQYTLDESDGRVTQIHNKLRLNSYATAENCIDALIKEYKIDRSYSSEEKRIIAGVRYQMILSDFSSSNDYVFVKDVPISTASKIRELNYQLSGAGIVEDAVRVYSSGSIFPHGIGYVGPIYAEEYPALKEAGYLINDTVGKAGIERAMETYLAGKRGEKTITVSSDGEITETVTKEAVPGRTVMLTVDSEFQEKLQNILGDFITSLANGTLTKQDYDFTDCSSGAIVVMDVKTGAVKGIATWPNYNINDLITDYSSVLNAEGQPMYNRALDGLYRPGSVMKTVTATAALSEGIINRDSRLTCHRNMQYLDIEVHCTGNHGSINVVTALQKSCNIFFYQVVQQLGLDSLIKYESLYGLGQPLGLEIPTSEGYLASPDVFAKFGLDWTVGQVLQAAIGQSEVGVTPLQMCVLASTIANKGVRYRPYLVDSTWDYNMTEQLSKTEPEVAARISCSEDDYNTIIEGMKLAAENTTAAQYYETNAQAAYLSQFSLEALPYPAAIKTGTPQASNKATQNSTVVGFYPADDPEIAFSAVIENGEYSKYLVRKIIEAYYGYEPGVEEVSKGVYRSVVKVPGEIAGEVR